MKSSRSGSLIDSIGYAQTTLGFDVVGVEVFFHSILSRLTATRSKTNIVKVLDELDVEVVHRNTFRSCLTPATGATIEHRSLQSISTIVSLRQHGGAQPVPTSAGTIRVVRSGIAPKNSTGAWTPSSGDRIWCHQAARLVMDEDDASKLTGHR